MVHTHHKYGSVMRRGRDDKPFGLTLQMGPSLLHGGENTKRLHYILAPASTHLKDSTTYSAPASIHLCWRDLIPGRWLCCSVDHRLPVFSFDCALVELALGRVMLDHVDHVVEVSE